MINKKWRKENVRTVLITGKVQPEIISCLQDKCMIQQWNGDGVMPEEVLKKEIQRADVLIPAYHSVITREIIESGKRLKLIAQPFVGYEKIDIAACTEKGIPVCNTASASMNSVADLAIALMLNSARYIVEGMNYAKDGIWMNNQSRFPHFGIELNGLVLGILGMGHIGCAIAKRARAFGMSVVYNSRHPKDDEENGGDHFAAAEELYGVSDVVMNTLPLTEKTFHMVNLDSFKQMKPTCIFINVGRGETVKTKDLIEALQTGEIAGAALDVMDTEPIPKGHVLFQTPHLIITPHMGADTEQTRIANSMQTVQNIINFWMGRRLSDCINPEVLKDEDFMRTE